MQSIGSVIQRRPSRNKTDELARTPAATTPVQKPNWNQIITWYGEIRRLQTRRC